jgi:hypothetical protein
MTFGVMRPRSPRSSLTRPYPSIVHNVPRQVGLRLAGNPRQLIERARRPLGDDAQQLAIASRQHFGERLRRGEPQLRLLGLTRRSPRATAMVRAFIAS